MIDPRNGTLVLGEMMVGTATSLRSFQESNIGGKAEVRIENPPSLTLKLHPVKDFVAFLVFNNDHLCRIRIGLDNLGPKDWADWSYESELLIKQAHDELLRQDLGDPPYEFGWGAVESVLDMKGGGSMIVVNYSWRSALLEPAMHFGG